MSNKPSIYMRLLAILYAGTGIGILWFWYQFFNEMLFKIEELRPLIANFQGYYDWEKSFVVPDTILAVAMFVSSTMLWFGLGRDQGRMLTAICAGAALFLGVLDLTYGFSTGLYQIEHSFGMEVLTSGLSILVIGLSAVFILSIERNVVQAE